jgi:hypothetical protein
MKPSRFTQAAALLLAFTIPAAFGLTVPVQEDSFSVNGSLSAKNGKATTLTVTPTQVAFVKFNFNDAATVPFNIFPGNIVSANLRIYLGKAKTPGNLSIHAVTAPWSEDAGGPAPSFDPTPIATLAAGAQTAKDFAVFDILSDIGNFNPNGYAIVSDAGKIFIPAKEGALPTCELNIETNYANDGSGNFNITNITATGNIGAGGTITASGDITGGAIKSENTSGNFFLFGGFGSGGGGGTSLMGAFVGKNNDGPQLRFARAGDPDFIDIGQDGNDNFVIENKFDTSVFRVGPTGAVLVGPATGKLGINSIGSSNATFTVRAASGDNLPLHVRLADDTLIGQFQDSTGNGVSFAIFNGVGGQPGGGSWANTSDVRLKKNIQPLTGALDHLMQLRSVTYEYIDPAAIHELPGVQTGFIAQEVEPIFPGWVGEKADGYKFVAVKGFESLTVQALRELRAEKDAQLAELRAENAALKAQLGTLADRLARLEDAAPARVVRAALK